MRKTSGLITHTVALLVSNQSLVFLGLRCLSLILDLFLVLLLTLLLIIVTGTVALLLDAELLAQCGDFFAKARNFILQLLLFFVPCSLLGSIDSFTLLFCLLACGRVLSEAPRKRDND